MKMASDFFLFYGFLFIRKKKWQRHKYVMLSAFGTSGAFLVSYVIYHLFKAGPKQYTGEFTEIYLFILLTHIVLAAIIIPLALLTLYRGWVSQLKKHRKIARITLPIWLYVSGTGVVIYLMLYWFNSALGKIYVLVYKRKNHYYC